VQPKATPSQYSAKLSTLYDSSVIGAGWIISQIVKDGELPVVFGSVTFKEHESRYSQPKLELYGLFHAVKVERHRLYGIHFRIKVDARSLIEMVNKPDLLPNAPGNRWLAFVNLFDFEIMHVPAERHKGPDSLSRRRRAEDNSDDSNATMDAHSMKIML
jgi:RNase H-like domain found in reverse transcriptase